MWDLLGGPPKARRTGTVRITSVDAGSLEHKETGDSATLFRKTIRDKLPSESPTAHGEHDVLLPFMKVGHR